LKKTKGLQEGRLFPQRKRRLCPMGKGGFFLEKRLFPLERLLQKRGGVLAQGGKFFSSPRGLNPAFLEKERGVELVVGEGRALSPWRTFF